MSANGAGVYVEGTFLMKGGSVTGNKAEGGGGGVYVADGGVFRMTGGTVKDNMARAGLIQDESVTGGGVYVGGTFEVSGKVIITGNKLFHEAGDEDTRTNNVYLPEGKIISVIGPLDPDTRIGVTMETPGVFTSGLNANVGDSALGSADNFFSDRDDYKVVINENGEAELVQADEGPVVRINGVTGSFNDRIKLNYYFDIPEEVLADEDAYVTLTNETTEKTETLLIKDAEYVTDKGYKFSIPLAAKEASDTITARAFNGQENALTIRGKTSGSDYTETGVQYSLMQYFTWLEAKGDDKEKAVGAAAKDYCIAAQIYFVYHADGLSVSSAVDAVTAETLSGYIAVREGTLPAGVSIKGITAMLESDNTLRLYLGFKGVNPGSLTFAIDGNAVNLKQRSDGAYYLAMDAGVWSNRLQDTHTYSVSDGTNTYTITASVLTYARSCAIKSDETEINLGKALYLYNRAAVAAFGQ